MANDTSVLSQKKSSFLLEKDKEGTMFVGLVCLDIVTLLTKFPTEDIGQRCEGCLWQRGGNAGNSSVVHSLLGGNSHFFGTLSNDTHFDFLTNDFTKHGVSFKNSISLEDSATPTSIVLLNNSNGTRTILHTNKYLRELNLEDFQTIDLASSGIGWIHFEGRDNAAEIYRMLSYLKEINIQRDEKTAKCITSLEVEKLRLITGMNKFNLWELPDLLFVSKDFAQSQECHDMKTAVETFFNKVKKGGIVVCAWGEKGAAAISAEEGLVCCPAFPPPNIVDTCGAGDTFNAAVIRALSQGKSLYDSIKFGCFVAGAKCGIHGFDELKHLEC